LQKAITLQKVSVQINSAPELSSLFADMMNDLKLFQGFFLHCVQNKSVRLNKKIA